MYQYKSEMTKTKMLSKQPPFFVPIMSSKYDVIVTVVAEPSKLQYPIFLGQAILHVEDWWTSFNQIQRVSFQTYRYPVDIQLQNSDRLLDGHVGLSVVSLNASMTSFSGQLAVRPNTVSKTLAAIKTRMGKLYVKNSLSYESSLSWCQNGPDIIQWGVLTETFLTVYNQGASVPCKNFDLRRIQLIHTTSPLHVKRHYLRIYYEGTIHTFGVDSSYDYGQWIYRIDANRRKLLVP
ncbi:hypothetical protein DYB32_003861 [Aphanomyces invadans]|uniref:Uncharacterized protein n=1 Tax=Aphanomyces invadans TaxID=157072 RepID=A0A418B6V2_9STRA|nr:hypothetical protein DYB32_003861 [Aphanomyces invadans]